MVDFMKQVCVLDTDSIVVGFFIELGTIKLIDLLSSIFDIYIPFFVIKDELRSALTDYEIDVEDVRRKLHHIQAKVIPNETFDSCLKVIERWLNKDKLNIDAGERFCLGLSLHLSRDLNNFVFLVTDDLRARQVALDKFVSRQKIGATLSSPDIILYAFARNRNISSDLVISSFQNFFGKMPAKKTADKKQEYMESFNEICRKVGLSNRLCTQECFSGQISPMPYF
jgi:hypothetical protein